jgi:AcrR family transcriptional regulator
MTGSVLSSPRRAETRRRLIEAAYDLIGERGVSGASLDAIAERAGLTKGAIYFNFQDKAELLAAVLEAKAPLLRPAMLPGAPLAGKLAAFADAVADLVEDRPRCAAMLAFQAQARGDGAFAEALEARYAEMFGRMAAYFAEGAGPLPIGGRELMVIVQALMLGFAQQASLSPADVTRASIHRAFALLARALAP